MLRYVLQRRPSSSLSWAQIQAECLRALQDVIHPETQRDLVYSGLIHKIEPRPDSSVLVHLDVDRHYRDLRLQIDRRLRTIPGIGNVEVRIAPIQKSEQPQSAAENQEVSSDRRGGLVDVERIVSVSSCKGGVGKSTVAVNLAYSLRQAGLRVGLLDADLFGPSLPTLTGRAGQRLTRDADRRVVPLDHHGVGLVSYGFLAPDPGAATVLRGPVSSQIVQQLALGTAWGQLDYLVIDTPPGTGDIQLSLMQALTLTANVVVTTPQLLSSIDVVKGLAMYRKLSVPTVAAVNNMAYFICDRCDAQHFPFGRQTNDFMTENEIPISVDLPIQAEIGLDVEGGVPTMLSNDPKTAAVRSIIKTFADSLHQHLVTLPNAAESRPKIAVVEGNVALCDNQSRGMIDAERLRRACQCAACLQTGTQPGHRRAVCVKPIGNYGVEIDWDDGHKGSIYSYDTLRRLMSSSDLRLHQQEGRV